MTALLAVVLLFAPGGDLLPWADVSVTAAASSAWWGLDRLHPALVEPSCPCDPSDTNPLDRLAVEREGWRRGESAANVALTAALLTPLVVLAATGKDAREAAADITLVMESASVTGLLTQLAKTSVARPYPYLLGPAPYAGQNADGVNYASFWSGHTAVPMAASVTFARLYAHRHPDSAWRWVFWTVGPALALAGGALQISARNHYPTDVMAGALVGAAVGWAVPSLRAEW